MKDWTTVLWSDARQAAEQAGLQPGLWPSEGIAPQVFFERLRGEGRPDVAALFLASSLPRLEAIAWIAAALPPPLEDAADYRLRRLILDAAQRWIDEPDDINRRAVHAIAELADPQWPETMLGFAIFFSGGSIAPEDLEPVPVNPSVSAHLGAAALQVAAIERMTDDQEFLQRALDLGHLVAIKGRKALAIT